MQAFCELSAYSLKDSTERPSVTISSYLDVFYRLDLRNPRNLTTPAFLYNHNRNNEANVNVAVIRSSVSHSRFRMNLALQAGTYVNDNYSSEPSALKHIHEGFAGLSLNKEKSIWLDLGIMNSIIGFESALSKDNWTLSRSILAENSPYYLAGAKITWRINHLEVAGMVCNGWQRITRIPGNSLPGFCTQLKYSGDSSLTLNWSTFIGSDDPDTLRRMRYFNNFYFQSNLTSRLGLILGFDVGIQQKNKGNDSYFTCSSPVVIGRYSFNKKWACAVRAEYYSDKNNVLVTLPANGAFQASGISMNLDHSPLREVSVRIEGRLIKNTNPVLTALGSHDKTVAYLLTSIAVFL